MDKRYQVFVSSTYQDLQEERQEVMHALLELDCIPSGMELFPAANESQWSLIKKVIEDCDYYVLILAGRYGSCGSEGMSYTEMEYRHAASIGKPIIAFLYKEPGKIQADKCEADKPGRDKLQEFRKFAEQKLCKYWNSPTELGSVVSRSLIQLIKSTPAIGWVRADELPDRDATLELLKLRKRADELESELSRVRTTAPKGTEILAQGEELQTLRYNVTGTERSSFDKIESHKEIKISWDSLFGVLAPLMMNESSERTLKSTIENYIKEQSIRNIELEEQFKGCVNITLTLNNEDFQTIKVQLRALGLITKSEKARSVKDIATYWTLTPYGDETMMRLRAIRKSAVIRE